MKSIKRDKLGRFIKGGESPRKGVKLSKEVIENLKRSKIDMWKNKEHPKGMLGKKQSEKWKEEQSERLKEQYSSGKRVSNFEGNSYWKGKQRPSLIGNNFGFIKGHIPWNKGLKGKESSSFGIKFSDERIKKLSLGRKGKGLGNIPWNKGLIGVQESPSKGKTYEESYGKERADEIKSKIKGKRAKQIFPIKDSSIELKIQDFLTALKIEFLTHKYMNIKNSYQCDILIPKQKGINKKTIIECDGDFFHMNPNKYSEEDRCFENSMTAKERWKLDDGRTKELIDKGFNVLRLWGSEIKVMKLNDFKERLRI